MSIVKLTGDLTGKTVVFHGTAIRKIDIPERFVNAIPHPMPNKTWLSEDDIASIICEVLPNKAEVVAPYQTVNSSRFGEVASFSEVFKYHNADGDIEFNVVIQNGTLVIESIVYSVTKTLKGSI